MKKKNQSNQIARECIVTALIQLTEQTPFSAITVYMKIFCSAFSIYLLCAYEGSLLSVYMAWLENGEKESIETLADILHKHTWQ